MVVLERVHSWRLLKRPRARAVKHHRDDHLFAVIAAYESASQKFHTLMHKQITCVEAVIMRCSNARCDSSCNVNTR